MRGRRGVGGGRSDQSNEEPSCFTISSCHEDVHPPKVPERFLHLSSVLWLALGLACARRWGLGVGLWPWFWMKRHSDPQSPGLTTLLQEWQTFLGFPGHPSPLPDEIPPDSASAWPHLPHTQCQSLPCCFWSRLPPTPSPGTHTTG